MSSVFSEQQLHRIFETLTAEDGTTGLLLVMQAFPGKGKEHILGELLKLAQDPATAPAHKEIYYRLIVELYSTSRQEDHSEGLHATRLLVEILEAQGRKVEVSRVLKKTLPLVRQAAATSLRKSSEERLRRPA